MKRGRALRPLDLFYDDEILTVDCASRDIGCCGSKIPLSLKELSLLVTLIRHSDGAVSRRQLLIEVWGARYDGDPRTLDVRICSLRKKLGKCSGYIETLLGVGYAFNPNVYRKALVRVRN